MDAIELLKKDHQKVTELFKRFNGGGGLTGMVKRVAGSIPERQRRQAADQICRELDVHALIEEEVFYPAVRALNDDELNSQLSEAFNEHATVKRQVAMIRNGIGRDADLQSKVDELQKCVDHHVSEEEGEMFPRVEELMDEGRRSELGARCRRGSRRRCPHGRRRSARRPADGRRRHPGDAPRRDARRPAPSGRARGPAARAKPRKRSKTGARGRSRSRRTR
jgi:hemerythrin superfamily protein